MDEGNLIRYTGDECPMGNAVRALAGKWKLPVLYVLSMNGTLRFAQVRRATGATNAMLSNTLQELEADGLVAREQFNEVPPHVEYSVTDLGKRLTPALMELDKWGRQIMDFRERGVEA